MSPSLPPSRRHNYVADGQRVPDASPPASRYHRYRRDHDTRLPLWAPPFRGYRPPQPQPRSGSALTGLALAALCGGAEFVGSGAMPTHAGSIAAWAAVRP
ncbi:hypothetical protein MPS_4119 [Mycobacterium pseudoshottsii JCM 15466]|uniref:Uncharacterized protein n=1 Tax=Mycobacterium ulcerans (strain Agy99) TaxID=362242 RepID=A0PVR2_MYCUA|nr:hypothetical protein MUL_4451 [Mycobacterium ulcerans Agy99]MBC9864434.1 hypothetical protein [Mycobacterium pseudoshottsii]GAQ38352.1 hypothetical protein MPS_4119 [Mycobacterium pseudoshottsii JCM 15466]